MITIADSFTCMNTHSFLISLSSGLRKAIYLCSRLVVFKHSRHILGYTWKVSKVFLGKFIFRDHCLEPKFSCVFFSNIVCLRIYFKVEIFCFSFPPPSQKCPFIFLQKISYLSSNLNLNVLLCLNGVKTFSMSDKGRF